MHSVLLGRPALDSLRALRAEPFLRLLCDNPPTFDTRAKAFIHRYTVTQTASSLMFSGHQPLAVALRDSLAREITLGYAGSRISISVTVEATSGEPHEVSPQSIAPGLDLALIGLFLPSIEDALERAERYLNGMAKLVYCSPELLINASRNGFTFRVRTDAPPVDAHLLSVLDVAMSRGNTVVICLRITHVDPCGVKTEALLPAKVIARSQPLRAIAVSELNRFISTQAPPAISMRSQCPIPSSRHSVIT